MFAASGSLLGMPRHGSVLSVSPAITITIRALAKVASTIWKMANRSPLAVGPKMPTMRLTAIAAIRNPGRVAQAANGMIAHSRYQGLNDGEK